MGGAGGIVPFVLSEFSVSSHGGCRWGRRPWSLEAQWRGIAGTYTKCNRSRGLDLWGHGLAAGITGRQRPKRMDRNSEQRAEVEAALRPFCSLRWYRQCSWQLWQGLQRLMCACWFVSLVWAAEQQRSDDEFRGWACGIVPFQLPCLNSNCQVSRLRGCKMLF